MGKDILSLPSVGTLVENKIAHWGLEREKFASEASALRSEVHALRNSEEEAWQESFASYEHLAVEVEHLRWSSVRLATELASERNSSKLEAFVEKSRNDTERTLTELRGELCDMAATCANAESDKQRMAARCASYEQQWEASEAYVAKLTEELKYLSDMRAVVRESNLCWPGRSSPAAAARAAATCQNRGVPQVSVKERIQQLQTAATAASG